MSIKRYRIREEPAQGSPIDHGHIQAPADWTLEQVLSAALQVTTTRRGGNVVVYEDPQTGGGDLPRRD